MHQRAVTKGDEQDQTGMIHQHFSQKGIFVFQMKCHNALKLHSDLYR